LASCCSGVPAFVLLGLAFAVLAAAAFSSIILYMISVVLTVCALSLAANLAVPANQRTSLSWSANLAISVRSHR
jgi:hypothetical protein